MLVRFCTTKLPAASPGFTSSFGGASYDVTFTIDAYACAVLRSRLPSNGARPWHENWANPVQPTSTVPCTWVKVSPPSQVSGPASALPPAAPPECPPEPPPAPPP